VAAFGALLQTYRQAAGLSQQELAERAGLSPRGISDLERGARKNPHPGTARRLAQALGLTDDDRARLLEARSTNADTAPPAPAPAFEYRGRDLPRELSTFVGRELELTELTPWLTDVPLVTIAGPGGAGKTRLALRLAHQQLERGAFQDGVALVELASLTDPRLVPRAIAETLGISELSGQHLLDVLLQVLRARQLLLIVDNCEHLITACADIASELLRACPRLRMLATSREPLRLSGELVYRIPPLDVPADNRLETLAESAAARLFLLRARSADSRFVLSEANAPAVGEICRRLAGLPLAIELAAARVTSFSPAEIARRLDNALLHLSSGGPRDAPARQQTLEGAMGWSYQLLEPDERRLFERLSVFVGGFSLAGAHAAAPPGVDPLAVLPGLVTKSMVQLEPYPDGDVRYRLLEPLRQFAYARLSDSGPPDAAHRALAEFILHIVDPVTHGTELGGLLDRWATLTAEEDNIRAALEWAVATADALLAVRIGAAMWMWWSRPDRQAQGRAWLDQILSMPNLGEVPIAMLGRARVGMAFLALTSSDMGQATRIAGEVARTAHRTGDVPLYAVATSVQSAAMLYMGEPDAAEPLIHESIRAARASGLRWIESLCAGSLAAVELERGNLAAAEEHIHENLRIARLGMEPWTRAMALNNLGDLMRARGDADQAGPVYEEARILFESLDPHRKYAPQGLIHNLGYVALAQGDRRRAAELFVESADIYFAVGNDRRGISECLVGLACTAAKAGDRVLAARLFGATDAELERLGSLLTPANQAERDRGHAALAALMDPVALAVANAAGRGLSLEEALEEARELTRAPSPTPAVAASAHPAGLTAREFEVAALVARGLSNRQIAEDLVITEKTTKNHVHHVLDKLGLRSRSELAASAHELGL
jgi:predicted ATPase/DNA-binding CsgD family transcriptional regulator/DNA-binding XRE family transcriptional regulator